MPIYEYQCEKCQKQFEAIQGINDKPLKRCKFCDGNVSRLISQTSFALKGGGWYQDGYSKQTPKKTEVKEKKKEGPSTQKKDSPKKKAS